MKILLWLTIGIMAAVAPALSAAPSATTATAPASQPLRLFDAAMTRRAEAIAPLQRDSRSQQDVRKRRREIETRLKAERDAEDRVMLALGWANWELAEAAAPIATRWMMGYRTRRDLDALGQTAKVAGRALDAAKRDMDALGASKDTAVSRRRTRWRETLGMLRLFAAGYEALAGAVPASNVALTESQDACREAALGLAELRENEDPDTAAAARLWQAALLEAGSRSRRDLEVLDLAMLPPERLPYDFFARILRCQIFMDRGSYVLVAALTLRMEERCDRWFGDDKKAVPLAKLTLTAVRINCLWRWAESLGAGEPDEAARQQAKADALAAKAFPPDRKTEIYQLDRAIPVFLEIPPVKTEPPSTQETTAPATSRSASRPAGVLTTSPASRKTPARESE